MEPISAISRLLVVDDDQLYRDSLVRAFSRRGLRACGVSSLGDAVNELSKSRPQAAVVDLRLGEESGLEVVQALIESDPALKIIVLTAYGTIATALEAVRLGAVNYLTKPIEVEQILAAFDGRNPSTKELTAIPTPEQVEWDYINRAVLDHDGNVSRAAQALGLHRRSLQRKLRKPPHVR